MIMLGRVAKMTTILAELYANYILFLGGHVYIGVGLTAVPYRVGILY